MKRKMRVKTQTTMSRTAIMGSVIEVTRLGTMTRRLCAKWRVDLATLPEKQSQNRQRENTMWHNLAIKEESKGASAEYNKVLIIFTILRFPCHLFASVGPSVESSRTIISATVGAIQYCLLHGMLETRRSVECASLIAIRLLIPTASGMHDRKLLCISRIFSHYFLSTVFFASLRLASQLALFVRATPTTSASFELVHCFMRTHFIYRRVSLDAASLASFNERETLVWDEANSEGTGTGLESDIARRNKQQNCSSIPCRKHHIVPSHRQKPKPKLRISGARDFDQKPR